MQSSHLTVKCQPSQGNVFIVGDLHGETVALSAILKMMQAGDSLYILGDLVDRGTKNLAVIDQILEAQQKGIKIHVIMGNHERDSLSTIDKMVKIIEQNSHLPIDKENIKSIFKSDASIQLHIKNGGKWLIDLFLKEFFEDKLIHCVNGEIEFDADSNIAKIIAFFQNLPYIIRLEGEIPANLVHADMPFNDNELDQRLATNRRLNLLEQQYAVNARERNLKELGRDCDSVITYCGHNIVLKAKSVRCSQCVRVKTNTVVIDVASHVTAVPLVINHTKMEAFFVGETRQLSDTIQKQMQEILAKINPHLQEQLRLHHEAKIFAASLANDTAIETLEVKPRATEQPKKLKTLHSRIQDIKIKDAKRLLKNHKVRARFFSDTDDKTNDRPTKTSRVNPK